MRSMKARMEEQRRPVRQVLAPMGLPCSSFYVQFKRLKCVPRKYTGCPFLRTGVVAHILATIQAVVSNWIPFHAPKKAE